MCRKMSFYADFADTYCIYMCVCVCEHARACARVCKITPLGMENVKDKYVCYLGNP
jgi:hypothetical protein